MTRADDGGTGLQPSALDRDSCRYQTVFLIGYRGAGKSVVGPLVAERLGWTCRDLDTIIATQRGKTIREIFEQDGEESFRRSESRALEEVCSSGRQVVATGGGIVLRAENRRLLRSGPVIWLTADAATLWARLQADPATPGQRPDLTRGGLAEIEEVLRIRAPLYAQCADLGLPTQDRKPAEIAEEIVQWLKLRFSALPEA